LATVSTAVVFSTDSADARHSRHRHYARVHHEAAESYSPAFSSIIVDGNSGATLSANNPDASRHPASLTKIMTLYLLFERLEAGKIKLDTEMEVSEHASEQAPTKLGLRPGQTIRVEDAIKGLVTRSANDAAVVIAEAIAGDEGDFAKLMTHKARALGMTRTVYRNASGLPDDDQVTTARDQSTLGRAIQDRFPRYYRYFSTAAFNYHGQTIRNHNHLIGSVEGVDGIKTGYTRASGFNLVTSMHRGNRFLVGAVMGGRSGGSRDAIMRNLLAENLDKAATNRTVAAITERNSSDANADVAEAEAESRPTQTVQDQGAVQAVAPSSPEPAAAPSVRSAATVSRSIFAAATAAVPPPQTRAEPAPLTNGVIQTHQIAAIPGSTEPMKPVKVKTVQVKAGQLKLAPAGPAHHKCHHTGTHGSAGDLQRGRRQGRNQQAGDQRDRGCQDRDATAAGGPRDWQRRTRRIAGVQPAVHLCFADDGLRQSSPSSPPGGCPAKRRHQAARSPHRMDRPGRRAGKRERSAAAHRGGAQSGPWPARQGRSVHRTGGRQRRQEAVPSPFCRP
jgi:D-alanyl-D-alanine carboxypeptidase